MVVTYFAYNTPIFWSREICDNKVLLYLCNGQLLAITQLPAVALWEWKYLLASIRGIFILTDLEQTLGSTFWFSVLPAAAVVVAVLVAVCVHMKVQ